MGAYEIKDSKDYAVSCIACNLKALCGNIRETNYRKIAEAIVEHKKQFIDTLNNVEEGE